MDYSVIVRFHATHETQLMVPVTLCMLLVILPLQTIGSFFFNADFDFFFLKFPPSDEEIDFEFVAVVIGGAVVAFVAIVGIAIVLRKTGCSKMMDREMIVPHAFMWGVFGGACLKQLLEQLNVSVDAATFGLFVWNVSVLGLLVLYWRGPTRLLQGSQITISALTALFFLKFLPAWAVWPFLVVSSVADIFFVLSPYSPFRAIRKAAEERNAENDPLSSYLSTATVTKRIERRNARPSNDVDRREENGGIQLSAIRSGQSDVSVEQQPSASASAVMEQVGSSRDGHTTRPSALLCEFTHERKLGLGDFILYSMLVGNVSTEGDWSATLACYVGVLIGSCGNAIWLMLRNKPGAIPGLPIPIFLGLFLFYATRELATPFITNVSLNQCMI